MAFLARISVDLIVSSPKELAHRHVLFGRMQINREDGARSAYRLRKSSQCRALGSFYVNLDEIRWGRAAIDKFVESSRHYFYVGPSLFAECNMSFLGIFA